MEKNKVEEKTEKKETAGNDNNIINEREGRLENERESERVCSCVVEKCCLFNKF